MKIYRESWSSDLLLKQEYLFGLFSILSDLGNRTIRFRLFGATIYFISFYCGISIYHVGFFRFSRQNTKKILLPLLEKFLKNRMEVLPKHIIAFYNRSGETYLLCFHFNKFLKDNNITDFAIVSPFVYLKDIFHIFDKNIKFIEIPLIFFELHFLSISSVKTPLFTYWEILNHRYFCQLEKQVRAGANIHFYEEICKRIKSQEICSRPVIDASVKERASQKLSMLGLKRFVYIAPEAQSNGTYNCRFWNLLATELYKKGIDVCFNVLHNNQLNQYGKTGYFTLSEAQYVASKAIAVVGVRSGFMDVISTFAQKIFCIYFPFYDRGKDLPFLEVEKVKHAFSLKTLSLVNPRKIYEYSFDEMEEKQLIKSIIKKIIKER